MVRLPYSDGYDEMELDLPDHVLNGEQLFSLLGTDEVFLLPTMRGGELLRLYKRGGLREDRTYKVGPGYNYAAFAKYVLDEEEYQGGDIDVP
ncbi:MAG: hypothetical protein KBD15_03500 [Candidatus Magasanikbacteria bacterium]|nr:hypothetical protein [Candidatus Magasanikbacteria bacterium]